MIRKVGLLTAVLCLALAGPASAVPLLQLYIEGATYDLATETWVTSSGSFKLWVIALNDGQGDAGPIEDVHLAAAYLTGESGSVTLTPTTTGGLGGFTDPSTPGAPTALAGGGDGAIPTLTDGTSLPTHGIYGAGTSFLEWDLGDMGLNDSPVADFINSFPTPEAGKTGTINVYDVLVSGFTQVHFDVYNHIAGEVDAFFGPFSHDSEGGGGNGGNGGSAPEPTTVMLLGGGLLGLLGTRIRRK